MQQIWAQRIFAHDGIGKRDSAHAIECSVPTLVRASGTIETGYKRGAIMATGTAIELTKQTLVQPSTGVAQKMTTLFAQFMAASQQGNQGEAKRLDRQMAAMAARALDIGRRAVLAEESGDEATAARCWKEVADSIDGPVGAKACVRIGRAYLHGLGVEENHALALHYIQGGIAGGESDALIELGMAYSDGKGVRCDHAEALRQFRRAAEADNLDAHYHIALALWNGQGTPQDYRAAVKHLRVAAKSETGINDSEFRGFSEQLLALAYEHGKGVPKDMNEARRWYRRAIASGMDDAREALAQLDQRREMPSVAFPRWALAMFLIGSVAEGVSLFVLPANQQLAIAFTLAALALWIAFELAYKIGARSRRKIASKFAAALRRDPANVRIGGRRWTVANGEFHHLIHDGTTGTLYRGDTNQENRHSAALRAQGDRRDTLGFLCSFVITFAAAYAFFPATWLGITFTGLLLIGTCIVAMEAIYQHGLQVISGAMVLDPSPIRPGRKAVEAEKKYGDAQVATEREARDLLDPP